ncbi:hypothetical protein F5B20DRAFT_532073 [Whalleya microplaca]|nr:hypothetical protein F5B20DRAFT_532073 [Whalleya microplaca]
MFALNRLALATADRRWNDLAVELAKAVHPRFMTRCEGRESMVWKVSVDMRRVLVPSKGHLDDVDGFVVFRLLRETGRRFDGEMSAEGGKERVDLSSEINDYRRVMAHTPKSLSGDPLDLGMSLWVAHLDRSAEWSRALAAVGLRVARDRVVPASRAPLGSRDRYARLAFREFGACLGIKCYFGDGEGDEESRDLLEGVDAILGVWEHKLEEGYDVDLRPINLVMYAAALIPGAFRDGYLGDHSGR